MLVWKRESNVRSLPLPACMKEHQLVDVLVDRLKRIGLRGKRYPWLHSAQKQKVQKGSEGEKCWSWSISIKRNKENSLCICISSISICDLLYRLSHSPDIYYQSATLFVHYVQKWNVMAHKLSYHKSWHVYNWYLTLCCSLRVASWVTFDSTWWQKPPDLKPLSDEVQGSGFDLCKPRPWKEVTPQLGHS